MKRLEGKVAIVTGSSSGIGRGIAIALAKEGCDVVVNNYREDEDGRYTVNEIKKLGVNSIFIKANVTREIDVKILIDSAVERFKKLDIMVNNAGILVPGTATELTEDDWDRQMSVNLKGMFFCTKHAILQMVKQGNGGRVINVSSVTGLSNLPGTSAYCASKGAVNEFTREAAIDYAKYGITVNAINPGIVATEMTKEILRDEKLRKKLLESTPAGRFGQPEDIGGAAVFLALDESNFITGHTLVVDGGLSVR